MNANHYLDNLTNKYPELAECAPAILGAYDLLLECFAAGGKLLVCGNGGSAADSEHIVGELMKGYMLKRQVKPELQQALQNIHPEDGLELARNLQGALPAISLVSQSALITAFANDVSAEMIFAQQVLGYGRPGDVILGISTSGNARNVLYAFQTARAVGVKTIVLTGPAGGKIMDYADVSIRVPGENTPAIQERHLPVYHTLCVMLENEFFGR